MLDIPNHHVKDDAHSCIDWEVRKVRPYNGGDWEDYWGKMPRRATPVIEDVKMGHITKAPINPNVIAKIHDRGADTTGKQWLSSNYAVEGKGGRIRADNDRTAGAFVLDYIEPNGVWDAVDAVHNYATVLRQVRPDDWSGELLLRTLHDCRMFDHPKFNTKQQKDIIMDMFDQVLRYNAMRGRVDKPPMDRTEMLDLAKQLLFRRGVEGLTSFTMVEPYSRAKGSGGNSSQQGGAATKSAGGSSKTITKLNYNDMTVDEKARLCCREYNSGKGCSKKRKVSIQATGAPMWTEQVSMSAGTVLIILRIIELCDQLFR